ncbi:MAG: hypothetical protein ACR2PK_19755, partial [Acidimicrobiales bacterium]
MIAAWCFQCGLDYTEDVAECVECGIPTVGHAPTPVEVVVDSDAADDSHLAYELHGWNGDARAAVEDQLYRTNIVHAWQGPTLLVREIDEDAVDEVISAVDDSMTTGASAGVDAEGGRVGFDLGARNQELHAAVAAKLVSEGVEHELMGNGFMLVPTELEDQVGDWVEEIQSDLRATDSFGAGVDGVDSHAVVESLFVAADILRRNTRDLKAQRQL